MINKKNMFGVTIVSLELDELDQVVGGFKNCQMAMAKSTLTTQPDQRGQINTSNTGANGSMLNTSQTGQMGQMGPPDSGFPGQ